MEYALSLYKKTAKTREKRGRNSMSGCEWSFFQTPGYFTGDCGTQIGGHHALDNKVMFDGSSIEGFVGIDESDLYLYPDTGTFSMFPWRPQHGKVARLICDVYRPDGTFYEGDPRYILKKVISEAAGEGYTFQVGPECEFSCTIWMTTDCRPISHTNRRGILTWVRWISGKTPAEIWS